MTDQSGQHARRLDDELQREAEAPLLTTPLGDPEADRAHRELLDRSELARFLRPSEFPADAARVLAVAREELATEAVLSELGQLPGGIAFANVAEIWEALGHPTEHRAEPGSDRDVARSTPSIHPEP